MAQVPEKTAVQISKTELLDDSFSILSPVEPSGSPPREWRPSFFRPGPLFGLAALLLAFVQIFASYGVLKRSENREVAGWKFKPSVYIAVLTACSNGAISFAAMQGAVITFWLRPLRGTTLAQMHRDWAYGSQIFNALRCGRHISLVAMACIFAALVAVDGPLLQRASSTQPMAYNRLVTLNTSIVPEVPAYWSGSYDTEGLVATFSNAMVPVMNDFSSRTPITGGIQGCNGSCTATVRAPALIPHRCHSNTTSKNFSVPFNHEEMQIYNGGAAVADRLLFESSLESVYGTAEELDFHTYLTADDVADTCVGSVTSTHCFLRSAIAEYDIVVTNGVITLTNAANPRLVSWANNTAITNTTINQFDLRKGQSPDWTKTTLGGVVNTFLFQYAFAGSVLPPQLTKPGHLDIAVGSQPLFMYQQIANYGEYANTNEACVYSWKDVRSATMAGLNELMFRIGVHLAQTYDEASLKGSLDPGVQTNYFVNGTLQSPTEVFKSDFRFYFAAAALELLTIGLVLSTYYGYWRLGRNVSFSPLEIAKAFGAALLTEAGSNTGGRRIASLMNDEQVRYGMVYSDAEPVEASRRVGTLMLSHREKVLEPESRSLCA